MVVVHDLTLADGRTLRVHDTGPASTGPSSAGLSSAGPSSAGPSSAGLTVLWHHGSPQTGAPLEPLLVAAAERGVRLVSYARPSYGGSSPLRGRRVASAATDVQQLTAALGITRFATMGASGGGPHALACAALLPQQVSGVATLASLALFGAAGLDFFAGMAGDGESLRAAILGRAAREECELTAQFDPTSFNALDYAALETTWASLGRDVQASGAFGMQGLIDDDLAFVAPWGFEVSDISVPVLVVQGGDDRVVPAGHGLWLSRNIHSSEQWMLPAEGHISVLNECAAALDWLLDRA